MKRDIHNPFVRGEFIRVSVVTEKKEFDYVKTLNGLSFAPGGTVIQQKDNHTYRRVASNEQLETPQMKRLLKADGIEDFSKLPVGARIQIVEQPGVNVSRIEYMDYENIKKSLISAGGLRVTKVNGKVVKTGFPQEQ
jgi:hypothetical protein